MSAQVLEESIRSRNGAAPSRKGCVVNGQIATERQAAIEYVPLPRPPPGIR